MGRSKRGFLDRGEKKRIKAGKLSLINHSEPKQTNYLITSLRGKHTAAPEYFNNARHAVVDTRRPAKSNESSILHAVLFCVLVVIVGAWALGY
jgi:hypothetical protein